MPTLIASYTSEAGGSERLLLDVAAGLPEPPLIACPDGWLADRARESGFVVLSLRARSLHLRASAQDRLLAGPRLAGHARELRRLCGQLQPETLVAWGMRTALASAVALRGARERPRLVFEHVDFLPGPVIARAVRAAAAQADSIVCVSHALARDLDPRGRLGNRIEVIHCGVDLDRYQPGAPAPGDDVLTLGAIVPWKRPDLALEIAAIAARTVRDLRLRVAGAPFGGGGRELLRRIERRAAEPDLAGRVDVTGPLADPRAALRDAACLLHCADREPFGLVLVEALASGTPVVAAAAGGPAEIVDESCGALYPPGDASAAAAALVGVMNRRGDLSTGARKRAETAFDLKAMQTRYTQTLTKGTRTYSRVGVAVTVVTVSHNSAPELGRLLDSVAKFLPSARVVVVDNASGDHSVTVARTAGATVIENDDNVGFGTAANSGVAAADTPVTVLANPDVELIDDSVARLASEAAPGRLYAPLLIGADGRAESSAHARPGSAAEALHALVPSPFLPRPLRRAAEPSESRRPRPVGWATAALIVAHTDTLRALGPFDGSIFMYGEDLDLGLRAAAAAVETWFHPEARALHAGGHSSRRAYGGEPHELLARQRRDVVARRLGPRRAKVDDLLQMTTFTGRRVLKRLLRRPADREAQQVEALRRVRKGVK